MKRTQLENKINTTDINSMETDIKIHKMVLWMRTQKGSGIKFLDVSREELDKSLLYYPVQSEK